MFRSTTRILGAAILLLGAASFLPIASPELSAQNRGFRPTFPVRQPVANVLNTNPRADGSSQNGGGGGGNAGGGSAGGGKAGGGYVGGGNVRGGGQFQGGFGGGGQ